MTPMITINFIDVRGAAIFQNEERILNNAVVIGCALLILNYITLNIHY
jgi:hypothetical protein